MYRHIERRQRDVSKLSQYGIYGEPKSAGFGPLAFSCCSVFREIPLGIRIEMGKS